MKIWIIGAKGFIGRNLAKSLGLRCQVSGLGHGRWFRESFQTWRLNDWMEGEITKQNLSILAAQNGKPGAIFHLAGGSSVGPSLSDPFLDMERSVRSTAVILEWIREVSPETKFLLASSAAVYGGGYKEPITETAPIIPFSPYGYHKRMAELLTQSYAVNFGLNVAVVRLFSVYGPGLEKQLLWDACTKFACGRKSIEFAGTGNEIRDWVHIDDAVNVLCEAIELASEKCLIINGGSGIGTSVKEITEKLCLEWGGGISSTFSGECRKGDPAVLVADTSLLKSLKIKCGIDWKQGLEEYVGWFKNFNGVK